MAEIPISRVCSSGPCRLGALSSSDARRRARARSSWRTQHRPCARVARRTADLPRARRSVLAPSSRERTLPSGVLGGEPQSRPYLTDYPNREVAAKVTIHQLLTHTGGTGDIFGPDFDAHRTQLRTLADYVELYGKQGLEFEPGSRWAYSNYGFILLGRVIEKVSGQSYYDYVRQHIYGPAGMTRSGSLPENEPVPGRSIGYMKPPGQTAWLPNTLWLPYRGTSAGGGYSTVEDLARFAHALLSHKLLSPDSTKLLITGKVKARPGARYAYGFEDARDADGHGWVGHGGGAPGMNGDLRIYPKSGYVIAVLANIDPPAAQRISEYLDPRLPAEG